MSMQVLLLNSSWQRRAWGAIQSFMHAFITPFAQYRYPSTSWSGISCGTPVPADSIAAGSSEAFNKPFHNDNPLFVSLITRSLSVCRAKPGEESPSRSRDHSRAARGEQRDNYPEDPDLSLSRVACHWMS